MNFQKICLKMYQYTKTLLILLVSAFFCKKSVFFGQNNTFTQSNCVKAMIEIFSSTFSFCKITINERLLLKDTINENISFTDYVSEIRLPDSSKLVVSWKNNNVVTISQYNVIVKFFDVFLFLLSCLVTGPTFMSISSLILELLQFPIIRDWPEIRKSEISTFELFPISADWCKLRILNLAQTSLKKFYWMLQNTRVTAFIVSELLRENQQDYLPPPLPHHQIRVKKQTPAGTIKISCSVNPRKTCMI